MSEQNYSWDQGKEIPANWVKFEKEGDQVIGRMESKRYQKGSGIYKDQWVYELLNKTTGEINYVGIPVSKRGTCDRLNKVQVGEIIGIKYDKTIAPTQPGMHPAKALVVKTFGMDPDYQTIPNSDDSEVNVDAVPFN